MNLNIIYQDIFSTIKLINNRKVSFKNALEIST